MLTPASSLLRLLLLSAAGAVSTFAQNDIPAPRPWEPNAFLPVTEARIATLPTAEQPAWRAYWQASARHARPSTMPTDPIENADQPMATPIPIPSVYSKGARLDAPSEWYASAEARTIADHVMAWQTPSGGWFKGGDYTRAPRIEDDHHDDWSAGTFDNDSTTHELIYLARVVQAGGRDSRLPRWRDSFLRGLHYLFLAQYPNGGFPQIYPLAGGYHDAITFNDDAMGQILGIFRDIAAKKEPYGFVPMELATEAAGRFERGLQCVLATQLRGPDGRRTVWGQQHDALTLQPCAARNFEPAGACSLESVDLVRLLITIPKPTPEIVAAIEGAMTWFRAHALSGVAWNREAATGTGLVTKAGEPDLWARFYELGTDRPIFGERNRMVHYTVTTLSLERRKGYGWYINRPNVLTAEYAAWQAKVAQ